MSRAIGIESADAVGWMWASVPPIAGSAIGDSADRFDVFFHIIGHAKDHTEAATNIETRGRRNLVGLIVMASSIYSILIP
ncbi:MAG: hypothetical protein WBR17_04990 [Paraburkholderia sp.]